LVRDTNRDVRGYPVLVSQFVPAVSYQATGKANSFVSGSVKWLKILALANTLIEDWQDEPDTEWDKLYLSDVSFGTVTAAQSFAYPATLRKLSQQEGDVVRILHTNGTTFTDYSIIDNNRQKDYAGYNRTFQDQYVTRGNRLLWFNRAFTSADPQFGGTIYANGYGYAGPNAAPNYLINDSDVIPVSLPNWLVYATAAAYDSTDVTRQQLVPRLEAKANELMDKMKQNNHGQLTTMFQPWNPTNMTSNDEAFQ
jgi:hypothetical protein